MFSDHLKECTNCKNEYRNQRLAQLYAIIKGECSGSGMASPTISNKGTKAASSVNQGQNTAGRNGTAVKRGIIVHPERQKLDEEKARKLALLIQEEAKLQAWNWRDLSKGGNDTIEINYKS